MANRQLLFTLIGLVLIACSSEPRFKHAPLKVTSSTLENDVWVDKRVTEYHYALDGTRVQMITVKAPRLLDGQLEDSERTEYEYDDDRLVFERRFWLRDGTMTEYQRTTYHYDDDRLAYTLEESNFGSGWSGPWRVSFSYEDGRLVRETPQGSIAGEFEEPNSLTDYSYDSDGRVTSAIERARKSGDVADPERWSIPTTHHYSYTDDGALAKDEGAFHPRERHWSDTYSYQGENLVSVRHESDDAGGQDDYETNGLTVQITMGPIQRVIVELTDAADSSFFEGPWFPRPLVDQETARAFGTAPWNRYEE